LKVGIYGAAAKSCTASLRKKRTRHHHHAGPRTTFTKSH